MAWYNPKSWFKKKEPEPAVEPETLPPIEVFTPPEFKAKPPEAKEIPYFGLFVPVNLHYGFGDPVPCYNPGIFPEIKPCLYIPDLLWENRGDLAGKRFDWNNIPRPWLANLELGMRFHKENWNQVKEFLV